MDIRPDYANIERSGELVQVDPEEVSVGDVIVVKAGERVPLDGTVLEGSPLWTPPPSPASPCPGTCRQGTR